MLKMTSRLPVVFISHGAGPAGLLDYAGSKFGEVDKNSASAAFLRNLSSHVTKEFKNILVISAHWEEKQFTVGYQANGTSLIYDYFGFPDAAYAPELTYPAPTDLQLSDRVYELLKSSNIYIEKGDRGFDHGMFVPLKQAYPDATIPVVELSLKDDFNIQDHIALGEALAPLRDEGTLILCSGHITHNLRNGITPGGPVDPRAVALMDWVREKLHGTTASNYEQTKASFLNIYAECPHFDWNHPTTDHFVPLLVALGAAGANGAEIEARSIYSEVVLGALGVEHYVFE